MTSTAKTSPEAAPASSAPETVKPAVAAKTVKATAAKPTTKTKLKASPKPPGKTPVVKKAAAKPFGAKKKVAAKAVAEKPAKPKKPKLVRDSFTIPKAEYTVLEALKERAVQLSQPAKKSEILRAGIKALAAMTDANLRSALLAVPAIKTGRPAADKAD